jgi:hypothetical protein
VPIGSGFAGSARFVVVSTFVSVLTAPPAALIVVVTVPVVPSETVGRSCCLRWTFVSDLLHAAASNTAAAIVAIRRII